VAASIDSTDALLAENVEQKMSNPLAHFLAARLFLDRLTKLVQRNHEPAQHLSHLRGSRTVAGRDGGTSSHRRTPLWDAPAANKLSNSIFSTANRWIVGPIEPRAPAKMGA
jgi:hypothetical protein